MRESKLIIFRNFCMILASIISSLWVVHQFPADLLSKGFLLGIIVASFVYAAILIILIPSRQRPSRGKVYTIVCQEFPLVIYCIPITRKGHCKANHKLLTQRSKVSLLHNRKLVQEIKDDAQTMEHRFWRCARERHLLREILLS